MIAAAAGETVIDCRIAVTVRFADPTTPPVEACIDVLPEVDPVARPLELTLATVAFVDFQVTKLVMLDITPPPKRPVAVNCC